MPGWLGRHESRRRSELQRRYDTLASAAESDAGADADKPRPEPSEAAPDAKPQWDPDVPTVVDLLSWEDRDIDRSEVSGADGRLA